MTKRWITWLALTIALATSACGRDMDQIGGMQIEWDPSKYGSRSIPRPGAGLTDSEDSLAGIVAGPYARSMGMTTEARQPEGSYTIRGPDGKVELRTWKQSTPDAPDSQ